MPRLVSSVWAELLIEELHRQGVGHICISPGSRSTPLTLAAAAHKAITTHVHFDERGLGFFALGLAKALAEPVAVITTSGTAVANLLPAVVEARQAHVPLILLTADRPPELLDCAANQAIRQAGIFSDYPVWSAELSCPSRFILPGYVLTTAGQAVANALSMSGPVHLNCAFREPFFDSETAEGDRVDENPYLQSISVWLKSGEPYTVFSAGFTGAVNDRDVADAGAMLQGKSCLMVIGELSSAAESDAVRRLQTALDAPVFADVLSGLRFDSSPAFIAHYDYLLESPAICDLIRPQVILYIGGRIVSKRLERFLWASHALLIKVSAVPDRENPSHGRMFRIKAPVAAFCERLAGMILASGPSGAGKRTGKPVQPMAYRMQLEEFDRLIHGAVQTVFSAAQDRLTEPDIGRRLLACLPGPVTLFCGNSMPIRFMTMLSVKTSHSVQVFGNRGASGIDGNIATIAGIAAVSACPVLAVIGDLTFLHDLNSLALLSRVSMPVVLLVVNNNGGGIFHFLPVAEQKGPFEEFFKTPHHIGSFAPAAALFGIHYMAIHHRDGFENAIKEAFSVGKPVILECQVSEDLSLALFQSARDACKALAGLTPS